jgi:uncharacterized protein
VALNPRNERIVALQLGREPRGALDVAHTCPCGNPDVVRTAPRLPDGTPFPTLYYLTCPRLTSAIGTIEASGRMRELEHALAEDSELAEQYRAAHQAYLAERSAIADVVEIAGVSAGGMPDRVKCLHVLVAHALAAGPGVNPLGDRIVNELAPWWVAGPCVTVDT